MAANSEQGEVELAVKGTTYTLTLKTRGLIALQQRFSTAEKLTRIEEIFERADSGSLEHVVAFVWASLLKHHPEMTFEDTLELVDAAGGVIALSAQITALSRSTVPDAADREALGVNARPRKARSTTAPRSRGTGAGSISTRDGLV